MISFRIGNTLLCSTSENGLSAQEVPTYSGYFDLSFYDYATPSIKLLKKIYFTPPTSEKASEKEKSEAVEPLVYYVDNSCPEPIKTALMDGARWWMKPSKPRGFVQCFSSKGTTPMPTPWCKVQHHPMGSQKNKGLVIWCHGCRSQNGEIIKGHVSLGSLCGSGKILWLPRVFVTYKKAMKIQDPWQHSRTGTVATIVGPWSRTHLGLAPQLCCQCRQ